MITPSALSYDPGYRSINQTVATPLPVVYSMVLANVPVDVGAVTREYTDLAPIERTGVEAIMPHDLWYYRMHFLPAQLALGNLSGDVQRDVVVWNAQFVPVTLSAVVVAGDPGVAYQSAFEPPGQLPPLTHETFNVFITASGTPALEASITWTVDGVDYGVPITGRRSVLLPFRPDWASGVTEQLQWRTSLVTAYNGKEQVKSLRGPRRIYEYTVRLLKKDESALYDQLLFGWSGRMFSVPIWNEGTKLVDAATAGALTLTLDTRFLSLNVGANVILFRSAVDYETVQVDAFDDASITLRTVLAADWPAGSRVYPMMTGALETTVSNSRHSDHYLDSTLRITASPTEAVMKLPLEAPPQTYQGHELYTRYDTNWSTPMAVSNESREKRLDNDLGPIRLSPTADFPLRLRAFSWLVKNRDADMELRAFLARREGRLMPVWMSSGTADLTLVEPTIAGDNQLKTRKNQYGSLINAHPAMRHILLVLRDGRKLPFQINGVSEDPAFTGIQLDQNFGEVITPAQVKRISYLGLYRLGADEVVFARATDTVAQVAVNFVLKVPA